MRAVFLPDALGSRHGKAFHRVPVVTRLMSDSLGETATLVGRYRKREVVRPVENRGDAKNILNAIGKPGRVA